MAFLRLKAGRIRENRFRNAREAIEAERDAWLAERQAETRSDRVRVTGKTFANRRRAAEHVFRVATGSLEGHGKNGSPREIQSFKARGKASMANPKRFSQGAASDVVRVAPLKGGMWRRYVRGKDGWRFASDHATADDALQGVRPVDETEPDRSGKVVWQTIEG